MIVWHQNVDIEYGVIKLLYIYFLKCLLIVEDQNNKKDIELNIYNMYFNVEIT